jgi:hypothetical protein
MMRIRLELHQTLLCQEVGDALNRLPRQAHITRDMRDWERHGRKIKGAEHLPPCGSQTYIQNQAIAGVYQLPV